MKLQELYEAAVSGKKLVLQPVEDVQKAIDILNTHCKNALWMLHENKPLWRGSRKPMASDFTIVDTSMSERRSENTSNYYTVILDNSPLMADFPKRSKSLICTTDKTYTEVYTDDDPDIIIPFDNANIGAVNDLDIWSKTVEIFGIRKTELSDFNEIFEFWRIDDTLSGLNRFAAKLKSNPKFVPLSRNNAERVKKVPDEARQDFMSYLFQAYSPTKLGFTHHNTANMKKVQGEVWVGGKVVIIKYEMWERLLAAYKSQGVK